MDGCSRQNPAYRPATEEPRSGGAPLLLALLARAAGRSGARYPRLGVRRVPSIGVAIRRIEIATRQGGLPLNRKLVFAAALSFAAAATPAVAQAAPPAPSMKDHAIIARDIIPSGEYGSVPPPAQADRQAQMYDALTPLFNHVTNADLTADFKSDALGATGAGPFTQRGRAAPRRDDQARPVQRRPHLRRHSRRRHLGVGLGDRRGPRPAAPAGPL